MNNEQQLTEVSSLLLEKIEKVYRIYKNNSHQNKQKVSKFIKIIKQNIHLLNQSLKNCDSTGARKHLETNIGHFKRFKLLFEALRKEKAVGGGVTTHQGRTYRVKWQNVESAFASRLQTGILINLKHKKVEPFLEDCFLLFSTRIHHLIRKYHVIKVNTVFCGEFVKSGGNSEIFSLKYFNTKNQQILQQDLPNLRIWFEEHVRSKILKKLEDFEEEDSGWSLSQIISLAVNINSCGELFHASSYIKLPKQIALKKAVINIKNDDEACFAWSVMAALFPANHHSDRVSSYPNYVTKLNLEGIAMPMTLKQIPKFEKQNDISINVYILTLRKGRYYTSPVHLTTKKQVKHVNLLLIQENYQDEKQEEDEDQTADNIFNEEEGDNVDDAPVKYHFCFIKNLSKLVSSQLSKSKRKLYLCDICLNYFSKESKLNSHIIDCSTINKCKMNLPQAGTQLFFKNYKHKEPSEFIIYSDIESILKKVNDETKSRSTIKYQKHEACSVGYYLHCNFDSSLSYYRSYRGEDCIDWYVNELQNISINLKKYFDGNIPIKITEHQRAEALLAPVCHICEREFLPDHKRVLDHNHFTGAYRGPAHEFCNLSYVTPRIIPVVFHNFSGYDSHFFVKNLVKAIPGDLMLLPLNKERYISFTKTMKQEQIKFKFIDSFRFMNSSLDKLASYLQPDDFKILRSQNLHLDEAKISLLTKKGVYPYDYISSWDKFEEQSLPAKNKFSNILKDSEITNVEYQHAQTVWETFQIKTLGEYSDLYLKTDIILLADVFENFRKMCRNTYGLCPSHYYTTPGYTWDAMLKYTKISLELLSDIDMLLFIEKGIRGGICQCATRYSKANNKYMGDGEYNPSEASKFQMYFDVNNLYGWAMSQALPYGSFEWLSPNEIMNLDIASISDNVSPQGYILEVDLEYPQNIHDLHRYLPFCAEQASPPGSKQRKLLTTLFKKEKYVIHYRNLKQCLEAGLKLTKVHRVLKFNQSHWLKAYIDLNTKLRTNAKNEFEKNLFKLMNNAVFGKTMENVRKHRVVKIVSKWWGRYGAQYYISKPNFHSRAIFDEKVVAIELKKTEIWFAKPIYIGMCILDLSKICVYDFHYNYMLKKFNHEKCKLLYTDTDSLMYEITCDDMYNVIKQDLDKFDTSDYSVNNVYEIPRVNKKVVGLMKDENNGEIMTEFVGLKSKMYSFKVNNIDNIKTVKRAKGVMESVVKNTICFKDYLQCLKENIEICRKQNSIRSFNHNVYSIQQNKVALGAKDDKRYILPNGIDTLPWGHYTLDT